MNSLSTSFPADYHTHTPLCLHAVGEPEDYVDRAIEIGLAEYGISDHAPQHPEPFDDWRMLEENLPEYFEWIERAKSHAGSRMVVRAGLECDWCANNEYWNEELASRFDWDYLIGSLHYLSDRKTEWDFDHVKWLERWAKLDVETAWDMYWKEYANMAKSGLFDFLGHPDLIKKFGYQPAGDLRRFYEPAIEAIAEAGVPIELNMAGLYKPCKEVYPAKSFLELAFQAGIPITLSSDAHAPDEVGRDFEQGVSMLLEIGYTETCTFNKRQRGTRNLLQTVGI